MNVATTGRSQWRGRNESWNRSRVIIPRTMCGWDPNEFKTRSAWQWSVVVLLLFVLTGSSHRIPDGIIFHRPIDASTIVDDSFSSLTKPLSENCKFIKLVPNRRLPDRNWIHHSSVLIGWSLGSVWCVRSFNGSSKKGSISCSFEFHNMFLFSFLWLASSLLMAVTNGTSSSQ